MNPTTACSAIELIPAHDPDILNRCLAVRREVFTVEKGVSERIERDALDVPGSPCRHFLITGGGRDAGALRCRQSEEMPENDTSVIIQRFCIVSPCRGQGLGRAALRLLEEYYRPLGVTKFLLDSKFSVWEFYAKCGFEKISDLFIEAGIEHVKMRKRLSE